MKSVERKTIDELTMGYILTDTTFTLTEFLDTEIMDKHNEEIINFCINEYQLKLDNDSLICFCETLRSKLASKFDGNDKLHCLWVYSEKALLKRVTKGDYIYITHLEDAVVLADLGEMGILYTSPSLISGRLIIRGVQING